MLVKKILIQGKIKTLTGLHIGGTNSAMAIGGPDSTVIRNPITNEPIIPGSSLKGKMRSLMELNEGGIGGPMGGDIKNGPNNEDLNFKSPNIFGTARSDHKQRTSRIIVRDAKLLTPESAFSNTDLPYTESKTEVVIDRITSKAMPRQLERVPAGAEFELNIVLNVFENIHEEELSKDELLSITFHALMLVQDDYLGGSGSRGSGQVKFEITRVVERNAAFYRGEELEKDISKDSKIPAELLPEPQTAEHV